MPTKMVVLIGFMGAGKTTVGRSLADRLGWDLLDTDEMVQAEAGVPIEKIWVSEGEASFRTREAAAVERAVDGSKRVIACGGGAILSLRNYTLLRNAGTIVYLRTTPEELLRRVGGGEHRPLLAGDPKRTLPRILSERAPAYEAAADVVVDTDGRTPELVADKIEVELAGRLRTERRA